MGNGEARTIPARPRLSKSVAQRKMDLWRDELESIRRQHKGGMLVPERVVQWAKSHPSSAIHQVFLWDIEEAAQEHWLYQARALIRSITVVLKEVSEPVRMYVSLHEDQETPSGGYRTMVSVLSDEEKQARFLAEALAELQRVKDKYSVLKVLAPLFIKLDHIIREQTKKTK